MSQEEALKIELTLSNILSKEYAYERPVLADVMAYVIDPMLLAKVWRKGVTDNVATVDEWHRYGRVIAVEWWSSICFCREALRMERIDKEELVGGVILAEYVRRHPELWEGTAMYRRHKVQDNITLATAWRLIMGKRNAFAGYYVVDPKNRKHDTADFLLKGTAPSILYGYCDLEVVAMYVASFVAIADTVEAERQMDTLKLELNKVSGELAATEKRLERVGNRYEKLKQRRSEDKREEKCITVTEKVVVKDTEESEALYHDLQIAQNRLQLAEEKLAIYEKSITREEYTEKEKEYTKEIEEFDISRYKILMVSSSAFSANYPFEVIDIARKPKSLYKCAYADYVLFDTVHNPHRVYYMAKDFCKDKGVPLFHINNTNRDLVVNEVKRLIMSYGN